MFNKRRDTGGSIQDNLAAICAHDAMPDLPPSNHALHFGSKHHDSLRVQLGVFHLEPYQCHPRMLKNGIQELCSFRHTHLDNG